MVTALSEAIERRDPYTGGHVRRVVTYSVLLGQELGLPPEQLEELRLAAILHDIGKIAVPDQILRKPARLDADEAAVMARHTVDGAEMVGRIRSLRHLVPGIRSHHERLDGRGYPDGLADAQLPLIPRIIGVADTFDAMTTDRPYRKALDAGRRGGGDRAPRRQPVLPAGGGAPSAASTRAARFTLGAGRAAARFLVGPRSTGVRSC